MSSDKPINAIMASSCAVCGLLAMGLTLLMAFFAVWFRSDSDEEVAFIQKVDMFIGLLFGVATLLILVSASVKGIHLCTWPILIFILVAGTLIFFHEAVWKVRTAGWPRLLAVNRVKMAQSALSEYARDCGHFPSEEQGLNALCRNLGEKNWKGPYSDDKQLIDPWGTPLQYRIVGERFEIWSAGADKVSGTEDDILPP